MTAKKNNRKNTHLENPVEKSIPRRSFLSRIWQILGIVITLEIFAVVYTFLSGTGKPDKTSKDTCL